jgi:hypothetical protein
MRSAEIKLGTRQVVEEIKLLNCIGKLLYSNLHHGLFSPE